MDDKDIKSKIYSSSCVKSKMIKNKSRNREIAERDNENYMAKLLKKYGLTR